LLSLIKPSGLLDVIEARVSPSDRALRVPTHQPSLRALQEGLLCTLGAGLLWGLVFIAPVLLPEYPAIYLSAARYLAFGVIAIFLASFDWRNIRALTRADWLAALELSLIGNLLYYSFLAAAIQIAGAPLPTMIIGALPLIISICANLHQNSLPWRKLVLPLAFIGMGVALVQRDEWNHLTAQGVPKGLELQFVIGSLLAVGALACWTWYPIRNARWLQRRPDLLSSTWANAQGLATLPLALLAVIVIGCLQQGWGGAWRPFPSVPVAASDLQSLLGPSPWRFLGLMLALGLGASWLGTLLWNRASQLLPASLIGQLIVFETLAAMLYAFIHRSQWPGMLTWFGIALLIAGVILGIRAFRNNAVGHQS
jgi:drug/metabolite transporter (DMT)-like permease